ncbi:Fic family protein [Flavonifractor hominis]|uniref:Fic family protein n=1 Tax=Flavonifractor hominis TaxID=3133178 RepID=A0ABV1EMS9_9FIRM
MDYIGLSKLFYQNKDTYEQVYQQRFHSEYAVHLDFEVNRNPAFFIQTPQTYQMLTNILRMNKKVSNLCQALPGAALYQFSRRCLIDEITLTNNIEGVRSTRKEISDILDELGRKGKEKRFYGLVQKYNMLMTKEELPLDSCQDVREIYNELVLAEVTQEEPGDIPDGKLFRKGPVSIYSPSQKEIHKGLYPEERILQAMEQALRFLGDDSCEILFRISIFHYLLEYIHPFYDGNGRLGRFICSYLLAQELEPVTGYRISYTIKENMKDYYQAFTICNDPLNRGDLTPFLHMFLKIVEESVDKLKSSLMEGVIRLNRNLEKIPELVQENDESLKELYSLLIQATLFSEFGVPTKVILKHVNISRSTLKTKLEKIPSELLVKEKRGRVNYYSLDVQKLENKN